MLLQAVSWQLPQALPLQLCVPEPLPALQTRLSAAQMPASMWKEASQVEATQAFQAVPLQLCVPAPLATVQLRLLTQAPETMV